MELEVREFTSCNGIQFKVEVGGKLASGGYAPVKFTANDGSGTIEHYRFRSIHCDQDLQLVEVKYEYSLTDLKGRTIQIPADQREQVFRATDQESFDYFYEKSRNGKELAKMALTGMLIHLFKIMCFDADGNYWQPCWFEPEVTKEPLVELTPEVPGSVAEDGSLVPAIPATYAEQTYSLKVNVTDGPNDGYVFRLVGISPTQDTDTFKGLIRAVYPVMVTSPLSMPCIRLVRV